MVIPGRGRKWSIKYFVRIARDPKKSGLVVLIPPAKYVVSRESLAGSRDALAIDILPVFVRTDVKFLHKLCYA